jgi:hypothetical protein
VPVGAMQQLTVDEAGNVNGFQVGLQCIIIFKTTHALQNVESKIMINLHVKTIQLIQEDGKIFVKPVCKESSAVQQSFGLAGFI